MTQIDFVNKFRSMIAFYPLIARGKHVSDDGDVVMTMNELVYILRQQRFNYSISDDEGGCIPSVKESFIPTSTLQRKIRKIVWDEEINDEAEGFVVLVDYLKE